MDRDDHRLFEERFQRNMKLIARNNYHAASSAQRAFLNSPTVWGPLGLMLGTGLWALLPDWNVLGFMVVGGLIGAVYGMFRSYHLKKKLDQEAREHRNNLAAEQAKQIDQMHRDASNVPDVVRAKYRNKQR